MKLPSHFTDFRVDVRRQQFQRRRIGWFDIRSRPVDNISVKIPEPPVSGLDLKFAQSGWQVEFGTQNGWQYALERTEDFSTWTKVGLAAAGTGNRHTFCRSECSPVRAFYRIRAERP